MMVSRPIRSVPFRFVAVWLCLLAGGCIVSMRKDMERWVGHDRPEIIQRWGAPDRTSKLDDGPRSIHG